jgi:CMP-N,N'-diacetyllegionaminic acid synthase
MKNKQHYPICVLIPFRFGEQELPNKNLQKIHNVYLFQRSLIHAIYLKSISNLRICLSTNKPQEILKVKFLKKIFNKENVRKIIKSDIALSDKGIDVHNRSETLSRKNSPINLTLENVRKQYIKKGITFDYWLLLQPTTPFRSMEDLAYIIKQILGDKSVKKESLISVSQVLESHPARMYYARNSRLISLLNNQNDVYKRRQALKQIYIRDGGFYLFSDKLAAKGKLFSRNPHYFVRKFPWTINIDTLQNLNMAKSITRKTVNYDPNNKIKL